MDFHPGTRVGLAHQDEAISPIYMEAPTSNAHVELTCCEAHMGILPVEIPGSQSNSCHNQVDVHRGGVLIAYCQDACRHCPGSGRKWVAGMLGTGLVLLDHAECTYTSYTLLVTAKLLLLCYLRPYVHACIIHLQVMVT